jgi:NADPH:quinone reductase-like Zn-dependent oxidoreductase
MKAIVYRNYGSPDVLSFEEIDKPTVGNNDVLIKVRAASTNPLDWKMMSGGPYIIRKLLELRKTIKRPGADVAGEVEAIGKDITQFKPGDKVFGTCNGAFAEYACSTLVARFLKSALALKPDDVTFEQAASAPVAALTALQGLRDIGRIQPGQQVLINGAAGGVGTFAVQVAKHYNAVVTAVCSTRNADLVRSIGADQIIDYTQQDFTTSSHCYDLIFDLVGNHSLSACRRALNPRGILVMAGAPKDVRLLGLFARLLGALVLSWFSNQKMIWFIANSNNKDLTIIGELMATGKVTPVIDRRYKLSEVPEALRYLEEGHARGKVVISPE